MNSHTIWKFEWLQKGLWEVFLGSGGIDNLNEHTKDFPSELWTLIGQ